MCSLFPFPTNNRSNPTPWRCLWVWVGLVVVVICVVWSLSAVGGGCAWSQHAAERRVCPWRLQPRGAAVLGDLHCGAGAACTGTRRTSPGEICPPGTPVTELGDTTGSSGAVTGSCFCSRCGSLAAACCFLPALRGTGLPQ